MSGELLAFATGLNNGFSANERRAASDAKLAELNARNAQGAQRAQQQTTQAELQLQKTQEELYKLQESNAAMGRERVRSLTYEALDSMFDTGRVKRLNHMLQETKTYTDQFAEVARFDEVRKEDFAEDSNLMADMQNRAAESLGVTRDDLDRLDGTLDGLFDYDLIKKDYIKQVNKDGTVLFYDKHTLANGLGYGRYDANRLASNTSNLSQEAKQVASAAMLGLGANGESRVTALNKLLQDKNKEPTVKKSKHSIAVSEEEQAVVAFTDAGGFDKTQDELVKDAKLMSYVATVENLHPLSKADKAKLIELSPASLAATDIAKLKPADVGYIDDKLNRVLDKLDEKGGSGVPARSAWGGFMAVLRHDMIGSAQTDAEMASFTAAYGSLGEEFIPAMSKVVQAMKQHKAKLEQIEKLNNPVIVHRYMGMKDTVGTAISNLDKKVQYYTELIEKTEVLQEKGGSGWFGDSATTTEAIQEVATELRAKYGLDENEDIVEAPTNPTTEIRKEKPTRKSILSTEDL